MSELFESKTEANSRENQAEADTGKVNESKTPEQNKSEKDGQSKTQGQKSKEGNGIAKDDGKPIENSDEYNPEIPDDENEADSENKTHSATVTKNAMLINSYIIKDEISGIGYYDKQDPTKLVVRDKGHNIKAGEETVRAAEAMAILAKERNWDKIKLTGSKDFKQLMWLEAESRGITTSGYKPTEQDLAALESRTGKARGEGKDSPEKGTQGDKGTDNKIEPVLKAAKEEITAKRQQNPITDQNENKVMDRITTRAKQMLGRGKNFTIIDRKAKTITTPVKPKDPERKKSKDLER
jgi:hypothetical protein